MATTNAQILAKIREITFDRFVTPTFFIAFRNPNGITSYPVTTNYKVTIDASGMYLFNGATQEASWLFADFPTLDTLMKAISASGKPIDLIYSGSFIPSEPSNSLKAVTNMPLDMYRPVFRNYYFSNEYIQRFYKDYLFRFECVKCADFAEPVDWDAEFASDAFDCVREEHFVLWVSFYVVGQRRLYELANEMLLQSSNGGVPGLNGPTDVVSSSSFSLTGPGENVQVNIGDVFTLSEDQNTALNVDNRGEIPEGMVPPWGVGSDNVLMDYYSFWYRLQLWIRDRFEMLFPGDYSLRKNQVMVTEAILDKKENWWAYFDNYPWTFSPYLRGIPNIDLLGQRG